MLDAETTSARGTRSSSGASRPASRWAQAACRGGVVGIGRRLEAAPARRRGCATPATRRPRGRRLPADREVAIASASSTRSARRRARRRRTRGSRRAPGGAPGGERDGGREGGDARRARWAVSVASHLEAMGVPAPHVRVVPLLTPPETYHCSSYSRLSFRGRDRDRPRRRRAAARRTPCRRRPVRRVAGGGVARARPGSSYAFDGVSRRGADAGDYLHAPPGGVGVSVAVRKAAAPPRFRAERFRSRRAPTPRASPRHGTDRLGGERPRGHGRRRDGVVVCARGGGGLLSERLHLAAELWPGCARRRRRRRARARRSTYTRRAARGSW